jgi:hypothetical protein
MLHVRWWLELQGDGKHFKMAFTATQHQSKMASEELEYWQLQH